MAADKPALHSSDVRDLIATVKSRRSIFEHKLDILQRRRDLKDVCDWVESMTTTDSQDLHESRARRLVHERQKLVQQQVKKNVEEKLEEVQQELKRQTTINFKYPKIPKYVNFNSRLLHQKRPDHCERCIKKRSEAEPAPGRPKPKDRSLTSTSATTRRPKGARANGIMSQKVKTTTADPFIPVSTLSRRTPRVTTSSEQQLAQSLKETLRISRQSPKVTLLSVTQKNNVPTSTKATNTGCSGDDDRVGLQTVVHVDGDDVDTKGVALQQRALSIRLLPGVSVPVVSVPVVDIPSRDPSGSGDDSRRPNVGHLDVWSAAEIGMPDLDVILECPHEQCEVFRPASSLESVIPALDADDDDNWLGETREWLERQLVEFVLSKLQLDGSPDVHRLMDNGGLQSSIASRQSCSSARSSDSVVSRRAEEYYEDTFEDSEILEDSEKKILTTSDHLRASPLGMRTMTSVTTTPRSDRPDDNLVANPQLYLSENSPLDSERPIDVETSRVVEDSHPVDATPLDSQSEHLQGSKESLAEKSVPEPASAQSPVPSGTWALAQNLKDIVSSSSSSGSHLLENDPENAMDDQPSVQDFEINQQAPLVIPLTSRALPNEDTCTTDTSLVPHESLSVKAILDDVLYREVVVEVKQDCNLDPEEKKDEFILPEILERSLDLTKEIEFQNSGEREGNHDDPNNRIKSQGHLELDGVNFCSTENPAARNYDGDFRTRDYLSETSTMDPAVSKDTSSALSTVLDNDDMFSVGEMISARKLRHVAFNRVKRRKMRVPEVTSEQSTASTLDGTDDLETDSDVWGASNSSTVWSEGEVRLDQLLGAILSRTCLTKEVPSTRCSPGEVRVALHGCPASQRVSFETASDIDDETMETPTSEYRSPGELDRH